MSFYIRIGIALLIIILLEFYFSKKIAGALKNIFPDSVKYINRGKYSFLIALNVFPVYFLILFVYSQLNNVRISLPESLYFDYFIMYPFWVCVTIVLQIVLILFIVELLKLLLLPLRKNHKKKLKDIEAKIVLAVAIFFFVYVPVRVIYDFNVVSLRIVEHKKNNLPENLNNFRIAFISDLQADRYTNEKRLERFINKVNETEADLVLIAGDVITSTPKYITTAAQNLGKIRSKNGVYTCVGDHDNWAYREDTPRSIREITAALKIQNVEMLDNERLTLNINDCQINITFITNTYVESIQKETLDVLSNHASDYDLNIFLTHQPREKLIQSAIKNKYDLFLAGHTHGGQITFLFPFINLTPTLIETTFVKGDRKYGNMLAVVTRGLGMSLAPIRYNSTPEVTLIVITDGIQ